MPITFACAKCRGMITVPEQAAGQWGSCPFCRAPVQAPAITPVATPPPTAAAAPGVVQSSAGIAVARPSARLSTATPADPQVAKELAQARQDPRKQFGRFTILNELGKGGMGVVYRAWDEHLGRTVAIKMLLADDASSDLIKRFEREAATVAKLHHPNIIAVHEVGEHEGKRYLVMDFIDGAMLEKRVKGKDKLPLTKAIEVMLSVCRAVHYAHEQGVIHRDLKPQNVMLDRKDHAFVMDFGLARVRSQKTRLTRSGQGLGTPAYMPPEQAEGGEADIDERADVYSLGATLYHVLTGRPPFEGPTEVNVINAMLTKDPDPPSKHNPRVAGDLETITLRCLEKEKEKRYASAEALARELERWLAGDPIEARPLGAVSRVIRRAKRQKVVTSLAAAVVVASVVGLGAWVKASRDAAAAEDKAEKDKLAKAEAELKAANAARSEADARAEKSAAEAAKAKAERGEEVAKKIKRASNALRLTDQAVRDGKFDEAAAYAARAYETASSAGAGAESLRAEARVAWAVARQGPWRRRRVLGLGDGVGASGIAGLAPSRLAVSATTGDVLIIDMKGVLETNSARACARLPGHAKDRVTVVASPDSTRIATACEGRVRFWDADGALVADAQGGHPERKDVVMALAWSSDGRRVASATGNSWTGADGSIAIWDSRTGKPTAGVEQAPTSVNALAFVRIDESHEAFFSAGYDQVLAVMDGAKRRGPLPAAHDGQILALAARPGVGCWYASSGADCAVKLWRYNSVRASFSGHTGGVHALSWSSDGRWLASGGDDGTVRILGFPSLREVTRLHADSAVQGLAWDPEGRWLAATAGGRVMYWDLTPAPGIVERLAHEATLSVPLAWSPDGKHLATAADSDKSIRIWNERGDEDGERIRWWNSDDQPKVGAGAIRSIAWLSRGERVAVASWNPGNIRIWKLSDRSHTDVVNENYKSGLACSVDDEMAAFTPADSSDMQNLAILDRDFRKRGQLFSQDGNLGQVAWRPGKGKRLIAVVVPGRLLLVEPDDPNGGREIPDSPRRVGALAWSQDGRTLAALDAEGAMLFWTVGPDGAAERATRSASLTLRRIRPSNLSFSPDERWIAAGGEDGRIRVWSLKEEMQPLILSGHADAIAGVEFKPTRDPVVLASTSIDGAVRLWNLDEILSGAEPSLKDAAASGWKVDDTDSLNLEEAR